MSNLAEEYEILSTQLSKRIKHFEDQAILLWPRITAFILIDASTRLGWNRVNDSWELTVSVNGSIRRLEACPVNLKILVYPYLPKLKELVETGAVEKIKLLRKVLNER